eukprot:g4648.t1
MAKKKAKQLKRKREQAENAERPGQADPYAIAPPPAPAHQHRQRQKLHAKPGEHGPATKRVKTDITSAPAPAPSPGQNADRDDEVPDEDDDELEDVAFAVKTLDGLMASETASSLKTSKKYKDLRRVVYRLAAVLECKNVVQTIAASSVVPARTVHDSRPAGAAAQTRSEDYSAAIACLKAQFHPRKLMPKLGALQRWVRQIDAAGLTLSSSSSSTTSLTARASCSKKEKEGKHVDSWRVLHALLSCYGTVSCDEGAEDEVVVVSGGDNDNPNLQVLCEVPPFCPTKAKADGEQVPEDGAENKGGTRESGNNKHDTLIKESDFFTCYTEAGADRRPPNRFPLHIRANVAGTDFVNRLLSSGSASPSTTSPRHQPLRPPAITRHNIPHVPGAFLLQNVLSDAECDNIRHCAENIVPGGYEPDEPLAGQPGESKLAHACVWMVSEELEREVWQRVKPERERRMEGLNRRWRFYRYVPGRYYRPHIDGAWPNSELLAGSTPEEKSAGRNHATKQEDDEEVQGSPEDVEPKKGCAPAAHLKYFEVGRELKYGVDEQAVEMSRSSFVPKTSHFTFLMYLNDDFVGGETRFFVPEKPSRTSTTSRMLSVPVRPQRGSILVFPHGECLPPLLHEGSPVLEGTKYVVRTELLARIEATSAAPGVDVEDVEKDSNDDASDDDGDEKSTTSHADE